MALFTMNASALGNLSALSGDRKYSKAKRIPKNSSASKPCFEISIHTVR